MLHNCEGQSHKTVSTDHNLWRERRAEADSNWGPSVYQLTVLLLTIITSQIQLDFIKTVDHSKGVSDSWGEVIKVTESKSKAEECRCRRQNINTLLPIVHIPASFRSRDPTWHSSLKLAHAWSAMNSPNVQLSFYSKPVDFFRAVVACTERCIND